MPKNNDLYTRVSETIDAWHREQVNAGSSASDDDIRSDVTEALDNFLGDGGNQGNNDEQKSAA
jgi:hypothetical protein